MRWPTPRVEHIDMYTNVIYIRCICVIHVYMSTTKAHGTLILNEKLKTRRQRRGRRGCRIKDSCAGKLSSSLFLLSSLYTYVHPSIHLPRSLALIHRWRPSDRIDSFCKFSSICTVQALAILTRKSVTQAHCLTECYSLKISEALLI